MRKFFQQLLPFIMLGVIIVAFAFGLMILAYIMIIGALLGAVIFMASWIREKLFPTKTITKPQSKSGRIIDSDDWRKL